MNRPSTVESIAMIGIGAFNLVNSIMVLRENDTREEGISKWALSVNLIAGIIVTAVVIGLAVVSLPMPIFFPIQKVVFGIRLHKIVPWLLAAAIAIAAVENLSKGYGRTDFSISLAVLAVGIVLAKSYSMYKGQKRSQQFGSLMGNMWV